MEYDTIFAAARRAGNELALVDAGRLSRTVVKAAALLRENAGKVLAANALDLEAMDADSPMRDRLRLTAERIASIAADMESVAGLPSPQGETIAEWTRPNGMTLRKVRVPFGVVGMICEARPNVTADIFSLSMKTGNACVLKGGSDARRSNEAIAVLLREALRSEGIDPAAFTLLPAGHEAAGALLNAVGYVDVVIPRGGAGLIRFVRENARIPVIETGAGIVHTYFDLDGDLTKGRAVVCNAKTPNASRSTPTRRRTPHSKAATPRACSAPPRRSTSGPNSSTTSWPCGPSTPSTKLWRTSPATPRTTAKPSSPKMPGRPGSSPGGSMRRAATSTSRQPSPTAASSDSAPRSASRPRNSTPAARWGCPNSRPTNT